MAILGTFLLLSSNRWSNLSVPEANQTRKYLEDKERMVWSPVWINVLQTIVWLPFKSHAQSSFDNNVLLAIPNSKMVCFCFGMAMPTLDWYTTLGNTLAKISLYYLSIRYVSN